MAESAAVAQALALAFLADAWGKRELLAAGERVLGSKPAWLGRLVRQVLTRFRQSPKDDLRALRELIEASRSFRSAFDLGRDLSGLRDFSFQFLGLANHDVATVGTRDCTLDEQ
jgi:hypothetical protein